MSYFPSPDEEIPCSFVDQHAFLQSAPTALEGSHRPEYNEWPGSYATNEQLLPTSRTSSWPNPEPHSLGLGLQQLPSTTCGHVYQDAATAAHSMSVPFTWPSEFTYSPQPPSVMSNQMTTDPWSDSCNPLSTLLPEASWDPPRQRSRSATTAYDASPSLSTYSTSSRPSAMSSPYAHSECYSRRAGTPMVKLEEPFDPTTPRIHVLRHAAPLEQSLLVSPGDLFRQTSRSTPEYAMTPSRSLDPLPTSETIDVKPVVRHERPITRKAYSCEDIHTESSEERLKRGFTKPENASCHCDTCGKLFQRSYNLKAHLETHDPHRVQPHVCQYLGCDKRFVRRTDLLRHEQSVGRLAWC